LCVLSPLHGHCRWTGDVTNHDWWTGATGAIRLDPAVFGDYEAIEKLREVLHHVVALWLTVIQKVQACTPLQLYDAVNFLAQFLIVLLIGRVDCAVVSVRLTDIGGLLERTSGGGWQCR